MSRRARMILFALSWVILMPGIFRLALYMPAFGAHPMPYGEMINAVAPGERHVTNMVSAINFDYRGFDTLGEEFMLLCAVTGTTVLLRGNRGEQLGARPSEVDGRPPLPRSDAIILLARGMGPVIILFGIYVAAHAMTTPGGGFQGGVIIASGIFLFYLGEGYKSWRSMMPSAVLDAFEGGGATLYALAGLVSMLFGTPYLTNILPYGQLKDVLSGGLMLVENAGVGLAVAGSFAVLFGEFLEETRIIRAEDE